MMDKPYNILFERTGGFAGLPLSVNVSSDSLVKTDRNRLDALMEKSNICNYESKPITADDFRDQFDYQLRVRCDVEEKVFSFTDNTLPPDVVPLVNYLVQLARWQKNQ